MPEIAFQIKDVKCEKCVDKIRKALENVPGLEEFNFVLSEKICKINGETNPIVIEQIIQETGYTPIPLKQENLTR
tara:strand:- start:84 stop:308 length:225 start_codon:yes stop_codon:yes gene_type:complete